MAMEKTQRKQSLNCLSNTPKLFDLNELLSSLKITPGQMENMKGLIYIEGLTEKQVRQRLSHAKIIRTNKFGVNSCLYYILFEDVKGRYLCLFNGDRECFRALFFSKVFTCKKLLMTKKKLPVRFTGQHFTIDKVLIKDAIRQANISNQDTVLDIGAGKGFLTVHLLKIANNVVAIENDTALVEHLRKLFSDARNVQVVGCDFRNFAVPKFPFKVVSNIPYGITSDIFKILMFESLGNFLGGSIVLQLEPTQKLFSRKLYNPYTVFYHTFFDLKLVYEVGPESFLPPPTVKSALLNIKRKHLFFDFKFKAKYLAFISCLLEKPDLSVKTALKSIFRKSQVRTISEKFGLNLNAQIVCLSPSQWLNCFLEMLEVVPEKFHPS